MVRNGPDDPQFDAALEEQILQTLKQAAIEVGQWTEKREAKGSVGISVIMARLNAGCRVHSFATAQQQL